ncbi:MAG: hypothetical protein WC604_04955 [Candidatus Gracilibacteria bacterium]
MTERPHLHLVEDNASQESALPSHLQMTINKGQMTARQAISITVKPNLKTIVDPDKIALPRHLQMSVDAGKMTREQALGHMGY